MSSGFITETEAVEVRKKRQEEWERVRNADDPIERPEEPFDGRSLYDRLKEQKDKKDLEYEEAHKLKNMIKGLDDDEIEFLDLVDRTKLAADRKKSLEEEKELNDYRNRVATLQQKSLDQKLDVVPNKPKSTITRNSQLKLLQGVVVKKNEVKKRKIEQANHPSTALTCIGILPGLGCYDDSSSDETSSSDSDDEPKKQLPKLDLCGRKIEKKEA